MSYIYNCLSYCIAFLTADHFNCSLHVFWTCIHGCQWLFSLFTCCRLPSFWDYNDMFITAFCAWRRSDSSKQCTATKKNGGSKCYVQVSTFCHWKTPGNVLENDLLKEAETQEWNRNYQATCITILNPICLSLALRYIHALYLGAQSRWHSNGPRRHFHWRLMFESADITMLRLLEAFLKSAPQLVLQLSIMIHGNTVLPLQGEREAVPALLWRVETRSFLKFGTWRCHYNEVEIEQHLETNQISKIISTTLFGRPTEMRENNLRPTL